MIQFSQEIQSSYLKLKIKIESNYYSFPTSAEKFIKILKEFNYEIFHMTKISYFGNFRTSKIFFDKDQHQREGSKPENIASELTDLYHNYFLNLSEEIWNNEERFLRLCSIFLESFFRIHPFPDGNGRTGRMFLILMGIHSKSFQFERFDIHKTDEKNYINALRIAHKLYNHENLIKRGKAFEPLKQWLKLKLSNPADFSGIEEPPI
ncbi:Fic family protein [Pigmentibacter sp. JX0631]|uniref:Fic family protein n=1 Tax=Pigmentibacter sp. JX0631 TaxID=2976982 RepID=UPI0024684440|nr:Fic family protein [Pigmentibacter sp. JX0631]WGL58598.1 Fic family protein [Pigmentibacter sp. JX0631]